MFETAIDADALLGRLRVDAASLVERAVGSRDWSAPERDAALRSLDLILAAVSQARAHVLVAERDAGTTQRPGDRSFEAARARVTRSSAREATRQVRQADALVSMPTVAGAVTDGRMPLGHLDALARVAATASPQVASVLRSADAQVTVVQMAVAQSEPDFATSLARFAAAKDPAALEGSHQDARRERFLTLSHQPHGTYLKGFLDRISAEALQTALDSAGQVPDENRSPGQATADALVLVANRACAGLPGRARRAGGGGGGAGGGERTSVGPGDGAGCRADGGGGAAVSGFGVDDDLGASTDPGAGASARAHVSLIVPAETFAELRTHYRAREELAARAAVGAQAGQLLAPTHGAAPPARELLAPLQKAPPAGALLAPMQAAAPPAGRPLIAPQEAASPDWAPVQPATLEDGTPVPMSVLAQALCDCEISRIVMTAEGVPVDLGRTKRTYTGVHRRAVIARDRHCAWNGCQSAARWAEVHHRRWWDRDRGETSIDNGVLLCAYHHGIVHSLDLSIQRHVKPPGHAARQRARGGPLDPGPARYTFWTRDKRPYNAPPRE